MAVELNEIWEEVKKAAGVAEKKAEKFIDKSKLKIDIMNVKSDIRNHQPYKEYVIRWI